MGLPFLIVIFTSLPIFASDCYKEHMAEMKTEALDLANKMERYITILETRSFSQEERKTAVEGIQAMIVIKRKLIQFWDTRAEETCSE